MGGGYVGLLVVGGGRGGGWEVGSVSPSYTWKVVPSLKITRNFELTFTSPRLSLCVHRSAPGPRPIVLACL